MAGEGQNIELAPVPLLGSVDVITTPAGAEIVINGKSCGISPNSVNNLPVGEHNLQITLPGYTQVDKMIVVAEGKVTEVNENLIVAAKVKSGTSNDKTAMNKGKINQQKVKKETVTIPENSLMLCMNLSRIQCRRSGTTRSSTNTKAARTFG